MERLLASQGSNQPVRMSVNVPVVLRKDKIEVSNAQIATPESKIVLSGAMDHLVSPRTKAQVNARVALDELRRLAGPALQIRTAKDLPRVLNADASLYMDDNGIRISSARMTLGQSELEASGALKDQIEFNARLATDQLERLFRMQPTHVGMVQANGRGRFNVPQSIQLSELRVVALGGSFNGEAALENDQFRVNGKLNHFDMQALARPFLKQRLGYDGIISGPVHAEGNTKNTSAVVARADLTIAPGRRGIPVSGRINADYNGRADTVTLAKSYIALPATRLDLSGSLGRSIQVKLVSRNLKDFQPLLPSSPIALNPGGAATFIGAVTGRLGAPHIAGHVALTNFAAEGRPFNVLAADLTASPAGAAVANGTLARGDLQAQFAGSLGLRNWSPDNRLPVTANVGIQNAGVQDLLALAGQKDTPVTGTLAATAQINGTLGDPRGNVVIDVVNGTAYEDHFDKLILRANLTKQLVDVPTLQLTAGAARIDANAAYQHPADTLESGTLRVHVASNQFNLDQFRNVKQQAPGLGGQAQILADATASLAPAVGGEQINLTSLNANVSARGLYMEGQKLGDLTATAATAGTDLNFEVNSDFAGSTIRVNGKSKLTGDHPTTATASIRGLPIERVLLVARRRDIPAAGVLSANANLHGTFADPQVKASFTVTKGMMQQQPIDRLQASVTYTNELIDVPSLEVAAGSNRIDFSGTFRHPKGNFEDGQAQFKLNSSRLQLAQLQGVQRVRPGLAGVVQLAAEGAATLRRGATPLVSTLNANLAGTGLTLNGKPAGDVTATAVTRGGELAFNLKSDFAQANIRGDGTMQLRDDYPLTAKITFAHVTYSGIQPWLENAARPSFEALAEGQATVDGPAAAPERLKGLLEVARLEVTSAPVAGGRKPRRNASLRNDGPVRIALDRSTARVERCRLSGTDMNFTISGTAGLTGTQALDLRADGNVNLALAEAFNPDIFSAGSIKLNAAVKGTASDPTVDGRLQLQNASFNSVDAPNGLSNANGVIVFNGNRAVIQSLSGESGGGKITLAGSVVYGGAEMQMHLDATARRVRIGYPENMSTEANATLTLAGTARRSMLSGNVTVLNVAMYSHSDVGSMLSQGATPPPVSQPKTGLLGGMQFDVRIRTSPNLQVKTSLAQNIQADADLRLRGTPDQPGMLGRLEVNQGEVVFFGSKYDIDQGTVSFYDPHKIEPILNVSLHTMAKGITVVLNVNGPMDKMKLTYSSDPPMQFSDIVALLATGKAPTTDPVLAARQPAAPEQNLEQKGASALLSQAVANPVSGRLQRLFGVSKLQIDPQIIGSQNTPQARLMLEQQITKSLLFTYTQDVASSNPQIIRVEWDIDPKWTAIAQRDERGELALDFFYKKRFR
jgi:translocation and assembly module TamB